MSCRLIFFILLLLGPLVTAPFSLAETTALTSGTPESVIGPFPSNGTPVDQCSWICQRLDNNRRPDMFKRNCTKSVAGAQNLSNLAGATMFTAQLYGFGARCVVNSGITFAKGIYNLLTGLMTNADEAAAYDQASACYKNTSCRPGLMRLLTKYREMNPDGSYKIPDSSMINEVENIHKLDFDTIWSHARVQFMETRNECTQYAIGVKMSIQRGATATAEDNRKIYNQIARERTHCISALQLLPPGVDERLLSPMEFKENMTTPEVENLVTRIDPYHQIWLSWLCDPDNFDKNMSDICAEVGSMFVPVPGSQIRTVGKVVMGKVFGSSKGAKPLSPQGAVVGATDNAAGAADNVAAYADTHFSPGGAATRAALIADYKGAVYATPAQNKRFIDLAIQANAGNINRARTRFATFENTAMKMLNGIIPKEFVTALTNFHKEQLIAGINAIKAKYPGLKIEMYSDFKSIQLAIVNSADISPEMHKALLEELNGAFAKANQALVDKMREAGVNTAKVGDPNLWFRGAIGAVPDEANIAARMARTSGGVNALSDFTDPMVVHRASQALGQIEYQRIAISQNTYLNKLGTPNESGYWMLKPEAFDIVRKGSPQEIMDAINARYKDTPGFQPISLADARKLKNYVVAVNEFNPAIFIPERVVLSMDDALQGAASADFVGLGAENYYATASALAGNTRIVSALRAIRSREQGVTKSFQGRQVKFTTVVNRVASGGSVKCSGDDCIKIFAQPVTSNQKGIMMDQLARDPQTRRLRVSFIGPGVSSEHRLMLATHGEEIEKKLRQALDGVLPYSRTSQLTFGLDMTSSQLNQGWVNLMIGRPRGYNLTVREQNLINKAFGEAMEMFNKGGTDYAAGVVSANINRLYLVPGPTLIFGSDNNGPD